jgi:hypothetical protein
MNDPAHLVSAAIGELRCTRPSEPASVDERRALVIARRACNTLIARTVDELRTASSEPTPWSILAEALGDPSPQAAGQRLRRRAIRPRDHT